MRHAAIGSPDALQCFLNGLGLTGQIDDQRLLADDCDLTRQDCCRDEVQADAAHFLAKPAKHWGFVPKLCQPYRAKSSRSPASPKRAAGGTLIGMFIGLVLGVCIAAVIVWYINQAPLPFNASVQTGKQPVGRLWRAIRAGL